MKKFLAKLGIMAGVIGMAAVAMAAPLNNPSSITLHVTPTGTKDMTLNTSTSPITVNYTYGVGSTNVTSAVAVVNTGNIAETYNLDVTGSGAWTLANAAGANTYHLQAKFNTVAPSMPFGTGPTAADFDLTGSLKASDASVFAGDQTGLDVAPSQSRNLWFGIDMPTSLTTPATNAAQDIVVQISAL